MDVPITAQVPATHHDLLQQPLPFVLTTVDQQGRPQSAVVCCIVDRDGVLKGSTLITCQKHRKLQRTPACSLLVVDPANDHRTLEIRATAELVPDVHKATVRAIAPKYGAHPERLAQSPGEHVTLVFHPYKVIRLR